MLDVASYLIIHSVVLFLAGFGAFCLFRPVGVSAFLLQFASSSRLHFIELLIRAVVGAAFLAYAPAAQESVVFYVVGWTLIITTTILLLLPWRLHRKFVEIFVPRALKLLPLIGFASCSMAAVLLDLVLGWG